MIKGTITNAIIYLYTENKSSPVIWEEHVATPTS